MRGGSEGAGHRIIEWARFVIEGDPARTRDFVYADDVVADEGEPRARDLAPELVGEGREIDRDRPADGRERGGEQVCGERDLAGESGRAAVDPRLRRSGIRSG